jgi:hypothetical protein
MTQSFSFAKPGDVVRGDDLVARRFIPGFLRQRDFRLTLATRVGFAVRFCSR